MKLKNEGVQPRLLGLTAVSLYKDIWKLAWPVMLASGLNMCFNLVDTFWVSRLGAVLVSVPSLAGSLLWLFLSLTEAISIGTVAMIARFEGAGRRRLIPNVFVHSFWLALAMAILIAVGVSLVATPLVELFTDDVTLIPLAVDYLYITLLGLILVFGATAISAALYGIGNTKTPMLVLMIANGLNMILDPILIFGWLGVPAMGVLGAAWATLIANGLAMVVLLVVLFRSQELGVTSLLVPFNSSILANILKIGMPASLQSASRSSTGTVMFWLVMSGYGAAAAAAFGAGQRIIGLIFVFISGLSVAATTLIGQVLGSGDKGLARMAARRLIVLGIGVQIAIGLLYVALAYPVSFLFLGDDAAALAAGVSYVRICGLGLALGASSSVLGGIFKGAGDTMPTFLAGFVSNWLVKLPMAAVGTLVFKWPVDNIWWAITASIVVEWLILYVWQRKGAWLEREIQVSAS
ncbi:MAG: MATE family efflux transporter [Eubacteriales bacterium]|nr:MATE family efflux transporter [Eubacteriales bacterium]MDD4078711.1 MATE family efflux transporter [Eubacteriales bacterium]